MTLRQRLEGVVKELRASVLRFESMASTDEAGGCQDALDLIESALSADEEPSKWEGLEPSSRAGLIEILKYNVTRHENFDIIEAYRAAIERLEE